MLRYRDLCQVETLFRDYKSQLDTRPNFNTSDAAIRGHVFCSFLALILKKELADRCVAKDFKPEWADVLRDLDRLQDIDIVKDGKQLTLRTSTTGTAGRLFQLAGVASPPRIRENATT